MGKIDRQPTDPPKADGDYRARNEARKRREVVETEQRHREDRATILEREAADAVLATIPLKRQAEAFGAMLSEPMPDLVRTYLLRAVPPATLAKRLDPDGYAEAYARLAGGDGKPAADPVEPKPTTRPETWRLTGTEG